MYGADDYFLICEDFGGRFDDSFPTLFFFFQRRSAHGHQFHFLGQDQSKVAQRVVTTVAKCFLSSCVRSHFPDKFPQCAWIAYSTNSNFVGSRLYVCLGVTCHLHFWHNDQGLLSAFVVTQGRNGLCRRKLSYCSFRDSNSQPLDHESGTLPSSYKYANIQKQCL